LALSIGLDWREFHTPPVAGGLRDQPISLMRAMRTALNTYDAIQAYRNAPQYSTEANSQYFERNPQIMKTMQLIWKLQEEEQVKKG
jgi:hypothetical protein